MDEDLRAALAAINDRLARIEARLDEIPMRIKPYDYEHQAEACTNELFSDVNKDNEGYVWETISRYLKEAYKAGKERT